MPSSRRALITGASGQDGHYLARYLVEQGRDVLGVSRRLAVEPVGRAVALDICNERELRALLAEFSPDEIYHLAAYHRSSAAPEASESDAVCEDLYFRTNVDATRSLLRGALELVPSCRVFLAGSCHVFGDVSECPQTEQTPVRPNSIYGLTKAANLWMGRYYRDKLGLFCVTGILYNHESPLRGASFVSGRIVRGVAQILRGEADSLVLGDLEARVDWGFAGDFARAMVRMLEAEPPQDLIIAGGTLHRVRDFVEVAFDHVGLDFRKYVRQRPGIHHPVNQGVYHGDITAIRRLGWEPRLGFEEMVRQMVDAQLPEDV